MYNMMWLKAVPITQQMDTIQFCTFLNTCPHASTFILSLLCSVFHVTDFNICSLECMSETENLAL